MIFLALAVFFIPQCFYLFSPIKSTFSFLAFSNTHHFLEDNKKKIYLKIWAIWQVSLKKNKKRKKSYKIIVFKGKTTIQIFFLIIFYII